MSRHLIRWILAILSVFIWPHIGIAQGDDLVSFHGARGDQVDMVVGLRMSGGYPSQLVRICLENPTQNATEKGLGNRRDVKPDLVVASGASGCLDLSPVRQTLVLWSRNTDGGFDISMMAPLDLRGTTGNIYFLRWSKEPAQNR